MNTTRMAPVVLLSIALAAFTPTFNGCKTAPTKEAVVYYTFKDTQTAVHTAYGIFAERVVLGKVNSAQKAKVEQAYRRYQMSFAQAFKVASHNWKATTPEQVKALADEILTLIAGL